MKKKRRTKQQKIIARLKRQLKQKSALKVEEKKIEKIIEKRASRSNKTQLFSYDPNLIKKDLIKTTALSLLFLAIIFLIQKFFPL